MRWLAASITWIMVVSGLLTCTMFYAALSPQASLRSTFGAGLAGASKLVFVGLVLAYGRPYLGSQAGAAVVVDSVMVAAFAAYLLGTRSTRNAA